MKKLLLLTFLLLTSVRAWATISNVTETHTQTSVTLTWDSSVLEFNPQVKYSADNTTCSLTLTASGTDACVLTRSVTLSGLTAGTTYCLRPQGQFCSGLSTDLGDTLQVTTSAAGTPTQTVTPSQTATQTSTSTSTATYTQTPTVTPTFTLTSTPSVSPSFTNTSTITASPTFTRTATPTFTATPTQTITLTPTPSNLHGAQQTFSFALVGVNPYTYSFTPDHQPQVVVSGFITDDPATGVYGQVLPAPDAAAAAIAAQAYGLASYISGTDIKVVMRRGGTDNRIFQVQYLY